MKSNVQIQCNPSRNSRNILHRNRNTITKTCMRIKTRRLFSWKWCVLGGGGSWDLQFYLVCLKHKSEKNLSVTENGDNGGKQGLGYFSLGKNHLSFPSEICTSSFLLCFSINCKTVAVRWKIPFLLSLVLAVHDFRSLRITWKLLRTNVPLLLIWTPVLRLLLFQGLSWNSGIWGGLSSGLAQIMWVIVIGVNQSHLWAFWKPFVSGLSDQVLSDDLLDGLVTQVVEWLCSVSDKGLQLDEGI